MATRWLQDVFEVAIVIQLTGQDFNFLDLVKVHPLLQMTKNSSSNMS